MTLGTRGRCMKVQNGNPLFVHSACVSVKVKLPKSATVVQRQRSDQRLKRLIFGVQSTSKLFHADTTGDHFYIDLQWPELQPPPSRL